MTIKKWICECHLLERLPRQANVLSFPALLPLVSSFRDAEFQTSTIKLMPAKILDIFNHFDTKHANVLHKWQAGSEERLVHSKKHKLTFVPLKNQTL